MTTLRKIVQSKDEDGFTFVEMLIALSLFGIISIIVSTIILQGMANIRTIQAKSDSQNRQQIAMEWTSKLIRYTGIPINGSTAVETASSSEIIIYTYAGLSDIDGIPNKVRIYLDPQRGLVTETWDPVVTRLSVVYTGPSKERNLLLAENIETSDPVFTYLDREHNQIGSSNASLSAAEISSIYAVKVDFSDDPEDVETIQIIPMVNVI